MHRFYFEVDVFFFFIFGNLSSQQKPTLVAQSHCQLSHMLGKVLNAGHGERQRAISANALGHLFVTCH